MNERKQQEFVYYERLRVSEVALQPATVAVSDHLYTDTYLHVYRLERIDQRYDTCIKIITAKCVA